MCVLFFDSRFAKCSTSVFLESSMFKGTLRICILTAKPLGPPAPDDMTAQSDGGVGQEVGQRWTGQKLQKEMAEERQRRGQDRPRLGKMGPRSRWGQDGPKMGQRWGQDCPRWSQGGPRWDQDGAKMGKDGAKMGQDGSRCDKMGQHAAKMGTRWDED